MICDRLRKLRKDLGFTQQEFADKLGIKRNAIATYEVGKSNPGDSVIALICNKFSVSESWLRTGEGEPFIEKDRDQQIEDMVNEIMAQKPEDFRRRFIKALTVLDMDGWRAIEKFIDAINEEMKAAPEPEKAPSATADLTPEEQEILRQYREKKNLAEGSSVSSAG